MKIKDLKIKIAMALTLVMMGAPAVKAFAAETTGLWLNSLESTTETAPVRFCFFCQQCIHYVPA